MSVSEVAGERIYTVNFRKAWITPEYKRTDRVVNILREFAERHMKTDDIKIDQYLNRYLWQRGKRNPPRRMRIRMTKDETDTVVISLYEELDERKSRSDKTGSKEEEIGEEEPKDKESAATGIETSADSPKENKDAGIESDNKGIEERTAKKPRKKTSQKKKSSKEEP